MSLILENLYLGSVSIAKDIKFLKEKKIKYILICAKGLQHYYPNKISYKQLNISDNPCTVIISYFPSSLEFIHQSIQNGAVLVHCLGGKSRSVTIVIAYVMFKLFISFEQAFQHVKIKHFEAQPNPGFVKQLKVFEQVLYIYGKCYQHNFQKLAQIMIDNGIEAQVAQKLDSIKFTKNHQIVKNLDESEEDNDEIQIIQKIN